MADSDTETKFVFYHYTPSIVGAIIFAILFLASTVYHSWQMIRGKTWFMIPFIIGGIFEVIGYCARAKSHSDKDSLGPFIVQSVLILVAPALFAASVYMILGRVILVVGGEKYALIKKKWLTKLFVAGDVMSFFVQSAGAGLMSQAKSASSSKTGSNIIIGGLVLQILFFGLFIIVALHFHRSVSPHLYNFPSDIPWRKHLMALYFVSLFILVRSLFRVIEYVQGQNGYLLRHEVFLYVFDAVLMTGAMVVLNVVHPAQVIIRGRKDGPRGVEQDLEGVPLSVAGGREGGGKYERRI